MPTRRNKTIFQSITAGKPSETGNAFWISAAYAGKLKKSSGRTGKWLFFVQERFIDDTWANVKKEVESGKLWENAKVSTALMSGGGVYVICVYTYDHQDVTDVMAIRERLREMGFKRSASYKTDEQTLEGKYSDNMDGLAKYKA
jgi:hypothetical protein